MNLRERLAGIDTNLDDVQAGAEATSRAADTLIADTAKFNGQLKGPLLRAVARHRSALRRSATAPGECRGGARVAAVSAYRRTRDRYAPAASSFRSGGAARGRDGAHDATSA